MYWICWFLIKVIINLSERIIEAIGCVTEGMLHPTWVELDSWLCVIRGNKIYRTEVD
jgi:hypothetical protein